MASSFSPPVNRYPALFCTTDTHDWPQLGSLSEWDKLKAGFYGNSRPSSSFLDTSPNEAEKSLRPRRIIFRCEFICARVCVCWCVLLVLNHIQDWSVVTTVPKLQVSPSTFGPNTQLLNPGKCFQPELGYRKAAQTSEQRQECPSSSKGSIWPFLYLQLNMPRLEGREGASVRKGWGMMEEREEAGLEFQHLLELYLQPILQQYWLKKRWIPLLPCMVLISALVLGQCWFTDGP